MKHGIERLSNRVRITRFACTALMALALAGCGIFGSNEPEFVFDTRLGPDTKTQIRELSGDLAGDKENARHSSSSNAPEDMTPESDNGSSGGSGGQQ